MPYLSAIRIPVSLNSLFFKSMNDKLGCHCVGLWCDECSRLQCFCGDVIPPRKIAQESCGTACPGSTGKKCGGTWALDVYHGSGSADLGLWFTFFSLTPVVFVTIEAWLYPCVLGSSVLTPMGCFEDNKDRVWPHGVNSLVRNSPELCQAVCTGFKYAGVERGLVLLLLVFT